MNDVSGRLGRWCSLLGLSLALECSSQQPPPVPPSGAGPDGDAVIDAGRAVDMGFNCALVTYQVQLQDGGDACSIPVALPQPVSPANVRVQDQSMVTIPYTDGGGSGWIFGDPETPIILVGSYCADALSGKLTTVNILVACPGQPIP